MSAADTVPVTIPQPFADLESDGLLGDFPAGRRLVGTQCDDCGRTMIGTRIVCSACVSTDVTRVPLPSQGVLYTFTRLHVGGEGVRALGYVDFEGDVRTLTDLREDAHPLEPGIRVELRVEGDDWWFAADAATEAKETDS
jgi:uncharacterized OB-fold protein